MCPQYPIIFSAENCLFVWKKLSNFELSNSAFGTGKTLLAKTLARFVNVPFVIADATTLTQASKMLFDLNLPSLIVSVLI